MEQRRHRATPARIVYVIGGLGTGGAEYQLYELVRRLDRTRFAPSVIALAGGGRWAGPIREAGVPVRELRQRHRMEPRRLWRLRAELRARRPHLLHTILWSGNSYGRLAAVGLGIPVVVAAERNVIRRPVWQRLLERLLDRMTTRYLTNAEAICDELAIHGGLPRRKMTVIHNGVDLERLPAFDLDRRPARRRLGLAVERRLVAQVGRLTAQKDHPTFLRAAATVATAHPDVDFVIVGDGPDRPAVEEAIVTAGLRERVHLLGLRHDVPEILAGVDVMVLASRWEGLPNVVIEAMATGAATVATDVGGCRDLLTAGAGRLVPVGDAAAIAREVDRLLRDDEGRTDVVRRARARVEGELSCDRMAAETMRFYEQALTEAGV